MIALADLLQELEQEATATRRVLERVPGDHLAWTPHPKSMTLGQLAYHVATLPGAIADISTRSFDVNTPIPRPAPANVPELLATLEDSLAETRRILGSMADADLRLPWRLMDGEREIAAVPRGEFLRSTLFNHWYHHRGQLTVYLRLLGVPLPAIYGPSADERPGGGGGS